MEAKVLNRSSSYFGGIFAVRDIIGSRVTIVTESGCIEFSFKDVTLTYSAPNSAARLGKAILEKFQQRSDNLLGETGIEEIAKRASKAWPCSIKTCRTAIQEYVWN